MERMGEQGAAAGGRAGDAGDELGAGLSQLLDEWAHGVVVMTPGGRAVHTNEAARRVFARLRLLELRNGEIHATVAQADARLQGAIARAAGGKRSLVTLKSGAETASLAVVPLKAGGAQGADRVALIFERFSICEPLILGFFARLNGLTPAEEQVLGIICQGYSAPDAAKQLRVAVSTVRSHVRSVCAKTGSSGVRDLVNRIAVLPPVALASQEPVH